MKYWVIGDEDTVLGFGMVGVQGSIATNASEAETSFNQAMEDKDIGIIIITERTAELIRNLVDRYIFTERFPLIVEIPDRKGKIEGKPDLREMVNSAIGITL
jgi:V/A-type H+-transporting ATPase subunit F